MRTIEIRRHTMRVKPGQHLSQAGVDLARLVGNRMGPFDRVVTSAIPRAFETAITMGFAVDEQIEQIGIMEDEVSGEVAWDAGFGGWGNALRADGVASRYAQTLAALWQSIAAALPMAGAALAITHGGIAEAGAVACLRDANHAEWGPPLRYCEGVRLVWDGQKFVQATVLRVPLAPPD